VDRFYTPPKLARLLAEAVNPKTKEPIVADFAAGDGQLLRAAVARWPKAKITGIDINATTILGLGKRHRKWQLARCDFFARRAREACVVLRRVAGKVDIIFLNPPFSVRGNTRRAVRIREHETCCSHGLAFLIAALPYLDRRGELVAIMPAGSLSSEMDDDAWSLIMQFYRRSIIKVNDGKTFSGCFARTVVIKLKARTRPLSGADRQNTLTVVPHDISIKRGAVDIPSLNGDHVTVPIPLVHTTELRGHLPDLSKRRIDIARASIRSYAVLIPRVGRPKPDKVCVLKRNCPVALSNCVLAVRCKTKRDAELLGKRLIDNWKIMESAYVGTCAQYTTIRRVREVIVTINSMSPARLKLG
jgi:hypothetical protein